MTIFINLKANSRRSDYCSDLSIIRIVYSMFYSIEGNLHLYITTNKSTENKSLLQKNQNEKAAL